MALVVFMRGVNVGGSRVFRPAVLAKQLAALDVVNVGAAGTYVVRKPIAQTKLRAELLKRLPFEAVVIICRGSEVIGLVREQPFPDGPAYQGLRRFVAVMARRPRTLPRLPVSEPPGDNWESKVIGVSGRFALSVWRKLGRSFVDPNGVVEKHFGVSATTRNWNTIGKICDILER